MEIEKLDIYELLVKEIELTLSISLSFKIAPISLGRGKSVENVHSEGKLDVAID